MGVFRAEDRGAFYLVFRAGRGCRSFVGRGARRGADRAGRSRVEFSSLAVVGLRLLAPQWVRILPRAREADDCGGILGEGARGARRW